MTEYRYKGEIVEVVDVGDKLNVYILGQKDQLLINQLEKLEPNLVQLKHPYENMCSSIYDELVEACKHMGYDYRRSDYEPVK